MGQEEALKRAETDGWCAVTGRGEQGLTHGGRTREMNQKSGLFQAVIFEEIISDSFPVCERSQHTDQEP